MKKEEIARLNDYNRLSEAKLAKQKGDLAPYNSLYDVYYSFILGIVVSFEKRVVYVYSCFNRDDLLQEGRIAFFKAVDTFDENGGASFTAYAYTLIYRRLLDTVQKANRGVEHELSDEYAQTVVYADNPLDYTIREEQKKEWLIRIDNELSALEARIIKLYIQGYSHVEIAVMLTKQGHSISVKSVANAIDRAKRKLRK